MDRTAEKRTLSNYKTESTKRGMAPFEVLGLAIDRELIRSLAERLAENDADASRIRTTVSRMISGQPPTKGGILAALRRSPLVGISLDVSRSRKAGRRMNV